MRICFRACCVAYLLTITLYEKCLMAAGHSCYRSTAGDALAYEYMSSISR